MKKLIACFSIIICSFDSFAQTTNSILVRHDTAILKAETCEWIIKSLAENDPALTSEIGKPFTGVILEAIEKGKLKAIDPETNEPIPAQDIFTWKMSKDTLPEYDNDGNIKQYVWLQRRRSPDDISQVKVYQDWYFDVAAGKFYSLIKWFELRENVRTSIGLFLGTVALCRIYY
ncbi:MAG TPA: hypothetical protein VHL77_10370 [Ferruginibacter sp.]|jgi:hypothetical protein|nr:hypothetical protein [Ferruginibacter sp.]